jgi:hypothetical protein
LGGAHRAKLTGSLAKGRWRPFQPKELLRYKTKGAIDRRDRPTRRGADGAMEMQPGGTWNPPTKRGGMGADNFTPATAGPGLYNSRNEVDSRCLLFLYETSPRPLTKFIFMVPEPRKKILGKNFFDSAVPSWRSDPDGRVLLPVGLWLFPQKLSSGCTIRRLSVLFIAQRHCNVRQRRLVASYLHARGEPMRQHC